MAALVRKEVLARVGASLKSSLCDVTKGINTSPQGNDNGSIHLSPPLQPLFFCSLMKMSIQQSICFSRKIKSSFFFKEAENRGLLKEIDGFFLFFVK